MSQPEQLQRAIRRARALQLRARGLCYNAGQRRLQWQTAAQRSWALVTLAGLNVADCRESLALLSLSRQRLQRAIDASRAAHGISDGAGGYHRQR